MYSVLVHCIHDIKNVYIQYREITTQVTKVRNFPRFSNRGDFLLKNFLGISLESFPLTDSWEILKKFPRIGHQDERFLWDHSFETQFREIPEKSFRIFSH